jgi:uncharacterized protein YkwD
MHLATLTLLALILGNGADPQPAAKVVEVSAAADLHPERYQQFARFDAQGEQELLRLTNRDRSRLGLRPLQLDSTLTAAARTHAAKMAARQELSHQFEDEPALQQRLAALHLDHEGENVALDEDVAQAHDGLMHSPHHRENLLRADYNVVGFGVARVGERIYVVEDFAHSLPAYPAKQAEDIIAAAVDRARGSRNPQLQHAAAPSLHDAACAMASQDRLNPKAVSGLGRARYVLTYTNMQPDSLPGNMPKVLADPSLQGFAVGACFAHTPTYPNGAYFVALALY